MDKGGLSEVDTKVACRMIDVRYYEAPDREASISEIAKFLNISREQAVASRTQLESLGFEEMLTKKLSDEDIKAAAEALKPHIHNKHPGK